MAKNSGWIRVPWFAVGLLVGALGMTWATADGIRATRERLDVPLRHAGEAHGAFCDIPDNGWYFYGRDLSEHVRSYGGLVDWCSHRGGAIGWID